MYMQHHFWITFLISRYKQYILPQNGRKKRDLNVWYYKYIKLCYLKIMQFYFNAVKSKTSLVLKIISLNLLSKLDSVNSLIKVSVVT